MTQAPALGQLTREFVATPDAAPLSPAAIERAPLQPLEEPTRLPAEWVDVENVEIPGGVIDRVIVGPNGVFAVHVDPDDRPVAIRYDLGMFRAGARVGEPVKRALYNTRALHALLGGLGEDLFPYPVLVTSAHGEEQRLGRLMLVRPGRLAEALWRHPSRPLPRSARRRVVARLHAPIA